MWIFVRYVISPFHPSFVYTSPQTIKKECGIRCSLCSVSLLSVKIWMEGTYDMPYKKKKKKKKKILISSWLLNQMGCYFFFAEMQIISSNCIILKHIQINSQFRKILMLKVQLSFFGTICTGIGRCRVPVTISLPHMHHTYRHPHPPPPPHVVSNQLTVICLISFHSSDA